MCVDWINLGQDRIQL